MPINKKNTKRKKKPDPIKYDNGGVKRIFSPFRFSSNSARSTAIVISKINNMPHQSQYFHVGLTPKEKSYVITSCQSRAMRYVHLKSHAANAIASKKIFSVYGSCPAVRQALLDRGWVEKIPANRMNLSKIRNTKFSNNTEMHNELERLLLSNLVEKHNPHFIWHTKEEIRETVNDMIKEANTIVNKLKIDALWTTKQGLCNSLNGNYWFFIEDVAEVNSPRTYSSYEFGEVEDFIKDYKITACTSLLKWILSMAANERPIFVESGKISMNVIVFALNRCKEYLFRKQNKDIDKTISTVGSGQWNAFIKKYYRIITKEDVFQSDNENKLPLYLGYAKFLLKEIHRYRPQLSCEGCHNIWIIKPGHCSRGRGIRMASKLGVITNLLKKANAKYVIQKYIEEPLLIYDTKFDIRQYYLITSTYPLVIWMYQDCYLKFSSQKYNLNNFHESIHLTNNAIQKRYKNCTGRHPALPYNNMWDLDTYKDYLDRLGREKAWDNIIYPGMRKSIVSIMLSSQDSLSVSKNRFELYGCDFILDKQYKTWLIEINSCPDLNPTTSVTAKICPAVIADIVKVIIDRAEDPKALTGKFECIYRQPMTVPRYGQATDLQVRGFTLPADYFYKGTLGVNEAEETPDSGKERDIKAVLHKLKQIYDGDIMIKPEDENDANKKNEQETFTLKSKSEDELNEAAMVITWQLDDLLERINLAPSLNIKSRHQPDLLISRISKNSIVADLPQGTKSMTDIKSRLKESLSRFASLELVNTKRSFTFSNLDDGSSLGKASCPEVTSMGIQDSNFDDENEFLGNEILSSGILTKPQDCIVKATTKIISFLHKKQKEYCT